MASTLRHFVLNNCAKMPVIGVGTYLLQGELCQEIIQKAIMLGYRHIDTAWSYENEKDVGSAVYDMERSGKIKRKDLFITTKLGRIFLHPRDVKYAIQESQENLKLKTIDMYLIHSPWGMRNHGDRDPKPKKKDGAYDYECYDLCATWEAMEKSVREGNVHSIGMSNFTEKQIQLIVDNGKIKPQNNQCEAHVYYQQKRLQRFCASHGIACTAYSPLGAPGIPDFHRPSSNTSTESRLLDDPTVKDMAKKYNRSSAQILLRYLLQKNFIVIPKTSCLQRLEENLKVFDFELELSDINALGKLDRGLRYFKFEQYKDHPFFPKENESF